MEGQGDLVSTLISLKSHIETDYSIVGSILGSPCLRKVSHRIQMMEVMVQALGKYMIIRHLYPVGKPAQCPRPLSTHQ